MASELWEQDAWQLAGLVRSKEVSAESLLTTCLERIEELDPELNSFVYVDVAGARAQAAEIDRAVGAGEDPGPLAGIPIGVKDLEDARGMPTTHGSLIFKSNIAQSDAIHVSRLRSAGAVILGKTAAPEFGSASSTETKIFGTTRNPWNPERTPGGSSGGSAAAVAAALVPLCTASDGGGSIRIPAGYSGLVGYKTTYGLVPRSGGDLSLSHTTHLGCVSRSVRDTARYLDCVAWADPLDRWSLPDPGYRFEDLLSAAEIAGRRAVWSSTLGFGRCEPEVAEIARQAAEKLAASSGIEWIEAEVILKDPARAWSTLGGPDLVHKLAPYWPEHADDLMPVNRLGMELSLEMPVAELGKAADRVQELNIAVSALLDEADFLITPTTATVAYGASGPMPMVIDGEPVKPMGSLPFTYPFNLTGHPAISLPAGVSSEGLPVGVQIVGRRHEDDLIIQAAALFEAACPWEKIAPLGRGR